MLDAEGDEKRVAAFQVDHDNYLPLCTAEIEEDEMRVAIFQVDHDHAPPRVADAEFSSDHDHALGRCIAGA